MKRSVLLISLAIAVAIHVRSQRLMDMAGKIISEKAINVTPGIPAEQSNAAELACAAYMPEVIINAGSASADSASYKIQKLK